MNISIKKSVANLLALVLVFISLSTVQTVRAAGDDQSKKMPVILSKEMFGVEEQEQYLYFGGTTGNTQPFGIIVPGGAVCVSSFSTDAEQAKSEYIIRYGTSDPNIAGVTSDGVITAAGEGTVMLTSVIELYGGISVIFERTITVKKAYICFLEFIHEMKIGEECRFTVRLFGYRLEELKWMTERRDGVVVGKNYGKSSVIVRAVSAKNDTIYVQLGDLVYEIKVKVTK